MLERDEAGLNALWAWSGLTEGPTPDWQGPLNRAEVPMDIMGLTEEDIADIDAANDDASPNV